MSKEFVKRVLEQYIETEEMIEKSKGELTEEILSFVLDNPDGEITDHFGNKNVIKFSQAYAILSLESEYYPGHYLRVKKMMGDKAEKTMSDAGGLLIGNEEFRFVIPNGVGDGGTYYAVLERNEFNSNMMNFITSCEGEFNIYNYDCDVRDGISETIEGRFGIYNYKGLIVFVRWN